MRKPSTRFYRLLLRAYPRAFRRSFGHRMEVIFASEWKRARAGGTGTTAAFLTQVLGDWLINVPREWFDIAANEGSRAVGTMRAGLWQDLKYGARGLKRRPALTVVLTVTLGVGIGGVAAIESVLRGTLFRGLPYDEPDRVQLFWNPGSWAPRDLAIVEEGSPVLELVAAYNATQVVIQDESGPASAEDAVVVSRSFFSVFGRVMQMGRAFSPSDEVPGASPVAVITHGLWAEIGRPDLGATLLKVDGRSVEIVGITAPGFYFPDPATRIFLPMQYDRASGDRFLSMITRVSSAVNDVALGIEALRLSGVLDRRASANDDVARFTPVRTAIFGGDRELMLLVAGALSLVFLMAVINVGALMLAQTERRLGELRLRTAIGASRLRLVRQLVTESSVIGLLGGGAAVLFGLVGFRLLMRSLPTVPGDVATVHLDLGFLFVTLVLGVGTGAFVGLVAALGSPAKSPCQGMGLVGRRAGRTSSLAQNGLVVSQVALTVLLVASAGVMVRSVGELSLIDTGVSPGQAVVLDVVAGAGDYPEAARSGLYADVREWVESLSQTASVGLSQKLPLRGRGWTTSVRVPGRSDDPMFVPIRFITPGYFEALGIPLISGRPPNQLLGGGDGTFPAWVNAALSERLWPAEDPAGRRTVAAWGINRNVVGVVGNVAEGILTDPAAPAIYVLMEQNPRFLGFAVVARPMPGASNGYAAKVASLIRERDPRLAVRRISTFEDVEQAAQGDTLMIMRLLVLLGAVALLVGAVGVHGVVSQWVAGRIRGWAVSLALGATTRTVLGEVLLRSVSLTATGVVVGLFLFVMAGRALETFVFGVARIDMVSLVVTSSVVVATGVLAAAVPAFRAVRTDPVSLLRSE